MLKVRVTDQDVVIPKEMVERLGAEVIAITEEPGRLLIAPVAASARGEFSRESGDADDPIHALGKHPVDTGARDGAVNHDHHLYTSG